MGATSPADGTDAERVEQAGATGKESPPPVSSARARARLLPRVLVASLARSYLTTLAGLVLWAVAPLTVGWGTYVVQSASMAPAVGAGDAVVAERVDPSTLRPGQIVVIDDPAVPGRLLTHRITGMRPDGTLVTRGDANAQADSTPVAREDVLGLVRIRVPYVGLPQVWWTSGLVLLSAAWALSTAAAVGLVATDPSRSLMPARSGTWRPRRLRRSRLPPAAPATAAVGALVLTALAVPFAPRPAYAAFSGSTVNNGASGNSYTAAPDFTAPDASAAAVVRTGALYLTGAVQPSGTYVVRANVTDTGNPASGTASVRADVSAVTTGQTAAALSATAATTVGGVSYNYASASLTANTAAGAKTFSVTMADVAGNIRTRTPYTVTVDGTAPNAADIDAVNKTGGAIGRPEAGDTLTYTFSEQVDPFSVLAGWTGAATAVTVRFTRVNNTNSTITVFNGTTQLPLGSVTTNAGYVPTNTAINFTGSTMTQTGAGISIVLGTQSALPSQVTTASAMTWTPVAGPVDAAGNAMVTTARTEGGASDTNF